MRRFARGAVLALVAPLSAAPAALAQEKVALRSDVLLYGDDTEFRNPFREGETLFGAAVRVAFDLALNERTTISLGGFGNQRFGSDKAFELARPVISLTVRGRRSSFTFGTLPAFAVDGPMGPDRGGPHGLLPPLQRETLTFDRPYEAGLQWDFGVRPGSNQGQTGVKPGSDQGQTTFARSFAHTLWLEWQRLNTPRHRERFDGGVNASVMLAPQLSIPLQLHVVHEGGQLFNTGPVDDSAAFATGVKLETNTARAGVVSLELYAAGARTVPDRQHPELETKGTGLFGRAAAERDGWRAHLIMWRGRHFIKDEGDPDYLSIRLNGVRYGGIRDYAEAGLARRMRVAPGAVLEISGRAHRTERYYEYSFRVIAVASATFHLR